MGLIKKVIVVISLACVASFAQQSATVKSVAQKSTPVTVAKIDSQKQIKSISNGAKSTNTTWTKIKDLFM